MLNQIILVGRIARGPELRESEKVKGIICECQMYFNSILYKI